MEGIDFKVLNSRELLEMFDSLVPSLQESIVKRGLTDAGRIILSQAKVNFSGVKKNKSKTNYDEINRGFRISPLRNGIMGVRIGNSYYKSLFIEKGTKDRLYKNKNGKTHFTGSIKATRFFEDAVNSKKDEAQSKVSESIINQLDKVVKKYGLK